MEIFREISSSSQSVVVLPSAIFPQRGVMPAVKSNDDTSCVLPVPPWPTMPTFRMSLVRQLFIKTSIGEDRPAGFRSNPEPGKLKLREENVAAAPGTPWGGAEGPSINPRCGLLTKPSQRQE